MQMSRHPAVSPRMLVVAQVAGAPLGGARLAALSALPWPWVPWVEGSLGG